MYTSINTYSPIIISPKHLKFRDNNISATNWHHRKRAGRHRSSQSKLRICKLFWKFPSSPSEVHLKHIETCTSHLVKTISDQYFVTFWRGEAGKQSGLLNIVEKQMEMGVGHGNQTDRDPVQERKPEGGEGRTMHGCFSNRSCLGNSVNLSTLSQQGPITDIWQHPQPYKCFPKSERH